MRACALYAHALCLREGSERDIKRERMRNHSYCAPPGGTLRVRVCFMAHPLHQLVREKERERERGRERERKRKRNRERE